MPSRTAAVRATVACRRGIVPPEHGAASSHSPSANGRCVLNVDLRELEMSLDWSLAVFVLLVVVTASSGVFFQPGEWYQSLRKPFWTPPSWLFGPVWSLLYIMIAIAGWLVWRTDPASPAMWIWALQLVLNGLWSAIFFGQRRMDWAFIEVVFLWLSVAGFILAAYGISPTAALLFVPYLIWVTIAATLNFTVWRMNAARPETG